MKNTPIVVCVLLFCVFSHAQAQVEEHDSEEIAAMVSEMISIPGGSFDMGNMSDCDQSEIQARSMTVSFSEMDKLALRFDFTCIHENPVHKVTVPAFKLGKHEVTFAQWDACVADGGCGGYTPGDAGWGRGEHPVINVSWEVVQSFIAWLNDKTGGNFRLPSEAEWEYAARAGSRTKYSWGDDIGNNRANCHNSYCGDRWEHTAPVGSFPANAWGLHDMHGNVQEWVQDCWNDSYQGAPTDGSAWTSGDCSRRVFRGGAWLYTSYSIDSADRGRISLGSDGVTTRGFRLAQDQ